MVQYGSVILSVYALLVTIAAVIMGYFLTISCGQKTSIKEDYKKIRNRQKVDILSPNIELVNNSDNCSSWELAGFQVFKWIVLSCLTVALVYWGLRRIFRKDGLLDTMKKRRAEVQSRKIQKMQEVLTKQGLIISDSTIEIEGAMTERPIEPFKG